MTSLKNYLIALLALTTVGGAALALHQYQELVELRAAAMNASERADLQRRAWDLEKLNRELQDQLAAMCASGEPGDALLADANGAPPPPDNGRGGRGGGRGGRANAQQQIAAVRDLMAKPEVQALLSVQQKAAIDTRYAAMFQSMNLQPEQVDKLKSLLAERQTTLQDVRNAAREQGIDPRTDPEGFRKLMADAQNDINRGIKSVIGDAGLAQLQNYDQTMPQRNVVNQLQQRLNSTNTPLTPSQSDQLVQILAANSPARNPNDPAGAGGPPPGGRGFGGGGFGFGGNGGPGFGGGGGPGGPLGGALAGALGGPGGGLAGAVLDGAGRGGQTAPVTTAAVAQAQTILAPPQVKALQQIQQQQQSQQQLQQLVRETLAPVQGQGKNAEGNVPAAGGGGGKENKIRKRG